MAIDHKDVYVKRACNEPAETFAGFKVGDKVRLNARESSYGAESGATASIKAFHNRADKPIQNYFYINLVWDRNKLSGKQMDGSYCPQDFELVRETPSKPAKPVALVVGSLTFDSLEGLSQAISEGVVTIKQEKTVRVKDGWVKEGDEVWLATDEGPWKYIIGNNMESMKKRNRISIKKPEYLPASAGRYTGKYAA